MNVLGDGAFHKNTASSFGISVCIGRFFQRSMKGSGAVQRLHQIIHDTVHSPDDRVLWPPFEIFTIQPIVK